MSHKSRRGYFKASVQYGDWHGTAAADNSDPGAMSVRRYLEKKDLIKPGEFLVAVELFVGETHKNKLERPYIRAYLLEGAERYEAVKARIEESAGEPIPVREVEIEVPLVEFVAWFKRFSVMLTWQGLPLMECEYRVMEKED